MTNNDTSAKDTGSFGSHFPRLSGRVLATGLAVVVLIAAAVWFLSEQNATSKGNRLQNSLSADYHDAANRLAECKKKSVQGANIAKAQATQVGDFLNKAIAGATDINSKAGQNQLMLLLRQAQPYPDTAELNKSFQLVMATVNGCQSDFRAAQTRVQQDVLSFRDWRYGSWSGRTFGGEFPNNNLTINLPGLPPISGVTAFNKMAQPIITTDVATAYGSGLDNDNGPFPGQSTPAAPTTPAPTPTK